MALLPAIKQRALCELVEKKQSQQLTESSRKRKHDDILSSLLFGMEPAESAPVERPKKKKKKASVTGGIAS